VNVPGRISLVVACGVCGTAPEHGCFTRADLEVRLWRYGWAKSPITGWTCPAATCRARMKQAEQEVKEQSVGAEKAVGAA
jgi:hypothetical protein